jgi:hypothetical protein
LSRYNINSRLKALGRQNIEVVEALMAAGYYVNPTEFSAFKYGRYRTPKAERVLKAADQIISEWEREDGAK